MKGVAAELAAIRSSQLFAVYALGSLPGGALACKCRASKSSSLSFSAVLESVARLAIELMRLPVPERFRRHEAHIVVAAAAAMQRKRVLTVRERRASL